MLEIKLERAYEPEMMRRQPCGICGAEFQPEAVLVQLVGDCEHTPICEACIHLLAHRGDDENIPAAKHWNDVYGRYLEAAPKYPEPIFPSVEAVMEAERRDAEGTTAYLLETARI